MPTRKNARDEAVKATDAYISALIGYFADAPGFQLGLDLDNADEELRLALAGVAERGAVDRAIVSGRQIISTAITAGNKGGFHEISRVVVRQRLGATRVLLDALVSEWDGEADLAKAESELARCEADLGACRRKIQQAVECADLDALFELRKEGEIRIPAAVDAARIKVLGLKLSQAEAAAQLSIARGSAAAERSEKATKSFEAAQDALAVAARASDAARHEALMLGAAATQTQTRITQLIAERDQVVANADRDQRQRFLALAGLPADSLDAQSAA